MKTLGDMIRGRELYTVKPDDSVLDAVRLMADKGVGAVLVVEGNRMAGIFTERDLVNRVIAPHRNPEKLAVKEVMTRDLIVAKAEEPYQNCLIKMRESRIRHLPVVSGRRILGVISIRDLIDLDIETKNFEIQQLNHFIHYVPPDLAG